MPEVLNWTREAPRKSRTEPRAQLVPGGGRVTQTTRVGAIFTQASLCSATLAQPRGSVSRGVAT